MQRGFPLKNITEIAVMDAIFAINIITINDQTAFNYHNKLIIN